MHRRAETAGRCRLGKPALSVDPLFRDPPQRQPEHALLALLPVQPQPASPLKVQHREGPDPANTEMGLKRVCGTEKLTAVVSKGVGRGCLPATEVVGMQHGRQPCPMQRILWWGLSG